MQKLLRVGVIGAGRMGSLHLRKLSTIGSVTVVGYYDPHPHVGHKTAEHHAWVQIPTLEELTFESDAVIIASPTPTHFAIAKKALELDVDVFIEKPMCETVREAEALVQLARDRKRVLQVGFLERYRLKRLLSEVPTVFPTIIAAERFSTGVGREPSVDVVSDMMIHDIDLVLSLCPSDPTEISAHGISVVTDCEDVARAVLKFSNGTVAYLAASRVSDRQLRRFGLGSSGTQVSLDFLENEISVSDRNQSHRLLKINHLDPLLDELSDFIQSSLEKKNPLVSGIDAVRSLRVRDSILSEVRGIPVKVKPIPLAPDLRGELFS